MACIRLSFGRCVSSSYVTSSPVKILNTGNYFAYLADDGVFKCGQHGAGLGQQISTLAGNKEAAQKCENAANGFAAGRDAIGAIRFPAAVNKAISGTMFWQTDENGWRKVRVNAAGPIRISPNQLKTRWKKEGDGKWHNIQTGYVSNDGKYIEAGNQEGEYILRDWTDIIMDILILVARLLAPVRWLHSLKAIDLGSHAQWMGKVVMGLWGMVMAIGLVQTTRDLIDEGDYEKLQQRAWEALQAFIDLISLPFDFGVGSSHPAVAAVGSGLNLLSAISLLAKEAVYYG
jgi:hypothetical protein